MLYKLSITKVFFFEGMLLPTQPAAAAAARRARASEQQLKTRHFLLGVKKMYIAVVRLRLH
jgi:hypothetical protein